MRRPPKCAGCRPPSLFPLVPVQQYADTRGIKEASPADTRRVYKAYTPPALPIPQLHQGDPLDSTRPRQTARGTHFPVGLCDWPLSPSLMMRSREV